MFTLIASKLPLENNMSETTLINCAKFAYEEGSDLGNHGHVFPLKLNVHVMFTLIARSF